MIRLILMIVLVSMNIAQAKTDDCKWNNDIPCVTIIKPNSNAISYKISPSKIITKQQIEKNNLVDVKSVLSYVSNLSVVQSGPTGQQTSVFMRGSNSNHTLVLLNGIPINDQSTTNGAFDFGQDFTHSLNRIEVYKGSAGVHFGADAVGGAINLITDIDYDNKMTVGGSTGTKSINGNIYHRINDWDIGLSGGIHESETESALKGGTDKDGVENKSIALTIKKWFTHNLQFRTNILARNTYADLDGHSLALQNGYDADNNLYALQTGIDYDTRTSRNYITLHTHAYERDYVSPGELDTYESNSYVLRSEHKNKVSEKFTYGVGFEYKVDEATFANEGSYNSSLDGDYSNTGIFANIGYAFTDDLSTTMHYRTDSNDITNSNESYKFGLLKENILPDLDLTLSHSTGFKNPSLYELFGADNYGYIGNRNLDAEESETNELGLAYKSFSLNLFETNIMSPITYSWPTYINGAGTLKQSGIELGWNYQDELTTVNWHGTSLSSKKVNGGDQLRRPEWSTGFNVERKLRDGFNLITNYNFIGEHFDIHNSNWSTIRMPEVHMLDLGITKDYYGLEMGVKVNNLLDEDYQAPHGFSQQGMNLGLIIKSRF